MATLMDFLETYGDVSFDELPFCEADNLVFCKLSYMPLENVVGRDLTKEPVLFSEAAKKMLDYNNGQHPIQGLFIGADVAKLTTLLGKTKRYGALRLVGCIGIDEPSPAVQFGVQTFILPDGTLVIPFRGTNDSLYGWKEDLDIFVKKNIPSYQLGLDYLAAAAKQFPDAPIIICGHSKGGNVALYTAMHTPSAIKARIRAVYNNDGPGFWDYRYLDTPNYTELLSRYHHFVPDASLIGLMLAHDEDYEVVRSYGKRWIAQHDIAGWKLEDKTLLRAPELTKTGKMTDLFLHAFLLGMSEAQAAGLDRLMEGVISASGQRSLIGISRNAAAAIKGAVSVWGGFDKETRAAVRSVFKNTGKKLADAARLLRDQAAEKIAERIPVEI